MPATSSRNDSSGITITMSGVVNQTVRGAMAADGDVTPVYKFRRAQTPYSTVRVMVYTPTGGAWVGTVKVQTSDPDRNVWVDEPGGSFTSDTAQVFEPGGDCDIRLRFTRTSGTVIGAVINS